MDNLHGKYSDNDLWDFYKFIQMVFIKDGKFKKQAFTGVDIYSQQLKSCFGNEYKRRVLDELIKLGVLRQVSGSYKTEGGFCKKYCLKHRAEAFYGELKKLVQENGFKGLRSKKRIRDYLDRAYAESLNFYKFSLGDCRIHSPWVTVNREWRHEHVTADGRFLACDLDLKNAYWSMLVEFIEETLAEYKNTPLELEFNRLKWFILCDIYGHFIDKAQVDMTRDQMKSVLNKILNSNSKQVTGYRGNDKKVYDTFCQHFPLISAFIKEVNDGEHYMGYLFSYKYESKIIYNFIEEIKKHKEFDDTDVIPIFDGIELFQDSKITEGQQKLIEETITSVLSPYKFIRMEYKPIKPKIDKS